MAIHPHTVQRTRPVALRKLWILGTGALCFMQGTGFLQAGPPGDPDTGFELDPTLPRVDSIAGAVGIAGNHLIVAWPTVNGVQILKLDPSGKSTATFTPIASEGFNKNSLAAGAGGVFYVGSRTGDGASSVVVVRRFNSEGVLDAGFNCSLPASSLDSMTPLAQGQLVMGAKTGVSTDFTPSLYLHRFLDTGLIDNTFTLQGDWGLFGNVRQLIPKGDEGYVLMGPRLEQVSLNGTRDGGFVTAAPKGRPEAMASGPGGGFMVAGRFDAGDGVQRPLVLRLHADGSKDEAFAPTPYEGEVHRLAMDAYGRVLLAGALVEVGGARRYGLARLNPEGGIDASFVCDLLPSKGAPAFIVDLAITALGVLEDGRVYVTGNMASRNGVALTQPILVLEKDAPGSGAPKLAELPSKLTLEEGRPLELNARPLASGSYTFEWRRGDTLLANQTDSSLRIVNLRTSDAGTYRVRITSAAGSDQKSIEVDVVPGSAHAGDTDAAYAGGTGAGGVNVGVNALRMSRGAAGRLYVAGEFTEFDGISTGPVVALDRRGQVDPNFEALLAVPGLKVREVTAIIATPANELYVAVTLGATVSGLVDRSTILKLQSNGAVDKSFNHPVTFGSSKIVAMGLDTEGRLLIARSLSSKPIARVKQSGSVDTTFQSPTFAMEPTGAVEILSICAVADKIYIAGSFNNVGGSTVQGVVRLLDTGDVDATYTALLGGMGPVRKIVPTREDQLVVALGSMPGLLLLNAEGAVVPTFKAPASLVWAVDVDLDSEGRILVLTLDSTDPENPRARVLRLLPDGQVDPAFDAQPGARPPVALVASEADDALIAGIYQDQNGSTRSRVVRLHGTDRQRVEIRPSTDGRTILRWASRQSRKYTIEETSGIGGTAWKSLETVDGTGSLLEWNAGTAVNSRFFRIRLD